MAFLTAVKETLDHGDPLVRTWPFVSSYYLPFVLTAAYVFFVKRIGPALMRNRKPFHLRNLMIVYNFSIVFTYTACLLTLIYFFLTTDSYKKICVPTEVRKGHYSYYATSTGWIIYMLKYIEFADTIFFVLRKKDHLITNLHVIHHSALPIIAWVMMRTERSGFQFIPGCVNSFVHIIMYTYYGLAAMGPEVQKHLWWKEYLTRLQMVQFIVVLVFVFFIIPLLGCKTHIYGIYIDIVFASLFLVLFHNFYTKTYRKKHDPESKNGAVHENGNGVVYENGMGKANGFASEYRKNGVEMHAKSS
ncbi:LOW QUALITY PROTEIN: elongation of very long chain fatty acids protein 1-like [Uloborus diversus]|uniref:LOW QUALITY PROTEIN: elongation of very long chain fatty acids protein 1-like n=1 Tax=Uloborus diversus TaxID=327109 RepID=UPI0024092D02|nr:LOW QUALITY PROTEIN: elongation of very long chain fatty acids protein 1-like [Uloborus diversus]